MNEHLDLGQELHDLHMRWQILMVMVSNRYPVNNKQVKALRTANEALSHARSEMDEQCCIDEPVKFRPHIYYPGDKDDEMSQKIREELREAD